MSMTDQSGLMLVACPNRGHAIADLGDNVEARAPKQAGKTFTQQHVIVRNHDPSRRRGTHMRQYPRCGHRQTGDGTLD